MRWKVLLEHAAQGFTDDQFGLSIGHFPRHGSELLSREFGAASRTELAANNARHHAMLTAPGTVKGNDRLIEEVEDRT